MFIGSIPHLAMQLMLPQLVRKIGGHSAGGGVGDQIVRGHVVDEDDLSGDLIGHLP